MSSDTIFHPTHTDAKDEIRGWSHSSHEDIESMARRALDIAVEEYSDILSFGRSNVEVVGLESHDRALGMIVPVGVEMDENFDLSGEPDGAVICIFNRTSHELDESVGKTVRHELAHLEDWYRRQTTHEHDESFAELCDQLDAEMNDC